jgi:glycine cleavage system H protein
MKRYAKSHEYISVEGDVGTMGISSAAADDLGDLVNIDLPKVGTEVTQGKAFCTIESVKAVQDIYAPVSGKVTAINEAILKDNTLVTKDSEGKGWLVKIQLSNPAELNKLFDADQPIG